MKFYMWANQDSDRLHHIKNTAKAYGIVPEIIGLGATVKSKDFVFKITSLQKAIANLKDDEIVCCTDAFDVLYNDDEKSIKEKFLSFDCDIVYCAQRTFGNQYKKYQSYFEDLGPSSPYKYVNSGAVIGYAKPMRKMLNTITSEKQFMTNADETITPAKRFIRDMYERPLLLGWRIIRDSPVRNIVKKIVIDPAAWRFAARGIIGKFSDQTRIGQYIATNPDGINIKLDYSCKLFWCIESYVYEEIDKHLEIVDNRITNKNTGNSPSFIHVIWMELDSRLHARLYDLIMAERSRKSK